jgi:serine/threonine-protein kinase
MAEDRELGPLRLGERFLKYEIQDFIGRGGHAWVYQGRDEFLENDVAIKILHQAGGVTPDMLRRGRAEAKLLYRLKHPNIVEVLDAGITDEGLLYIVMELLHGHTHRELLRTRKLATPEALELFAGIADGVEAAHRVNAIHRDLKPENVFVLDDNTPKVLDFGIAKVVDSAGFTTERDVVHGTMLYMAPERLQGHAATVRSDVYSLGVMLFETLSGRHPCLLKNTSPTMNELAWIQAKAVPPPLTELDPSIPRYVARTVDRAITKAPGERFASMKAFGEAIGECLLRFAQDVRTDRLPMPWSGSTSAVRGSTVRLPRRQFDELGANGANDGRGSERTGVRPPACVGKRSLPTAPPTTASVHERRDGVARPRMFARPSRRRVIAIGAATIALFGGALAIGVTTPETRGSESPQEPSKAALPARKAIEAAPLPTKRAAPVQTTREAHAAHGAPPEPVAGDADPSVLPVVASVAPRTKARSERAKAKPSTSISPSSLDAAPAPTARKSWAE